MEISCSQQCAHEVPFLLSAGAGPRRYNTSGSKNPYRIDIAPSCFDASLWCSAVKCRGDPATHAGSSGQQDQIQDHEQLQIVPCVLPPSSSGVWQLQGEYFPKAAISNPAPFEYIGILDLYILCMTYTAVTVHLPLPCSTSN